MAANLSSNWRDFLGNLQSQIPSIDSDSSSSESEDDLLDGLNLDEVIRTLRRNGPPSGERTLQHHEVPTCGAGDDRRPGDDLMRRLVSFSEEQQSRRLTSEPEPVQSAAFSRERDADGETERIPTVCIDLRCHADPAGTTPGTRRRLSVESKAAAKHSPRRRQGAPPETGGGQGGRRDGPRARSGGESGMSALLRKLRELNNKGGDRALEDPSLELNNITQGRTETPPAPADPTWRQSRQRQGSLVSHAEEEEEQAPRIDCDKADLLLLVSPAVPPALWGLVLCVCVQRSFTLSGLQHLRLPTEQAVQAFGLTSRQVLSFCKSPTSTPCGKKPSLSLGCLVLLLKGEKATHHRTSLPAALMREFRAQDLLGVEEDSSCFHACSYTDDRRNYLGRCIRGEPTVLLPGVKHGPEDGQVVVLSLCGHDLHRGLALLHTVLTGAPGDGGGGFQLLDLTWLPALTRRQAQELSPYEVGERLWSGSLSTLTSSPALVFALRRPDAFAALRRFLPRDDLNRDPGPLDVLMSQTPELAFRQAHLFFSRGEPFPADIKPGYGTDPLKVSEERLPGYGTDPLKVSEERLPGYGTDPLKVSEERLPGYGTDPLKVSEERLPGYGTDPLKVSEERLPPSGNKAEMKFDYF
ncbi:hypothetical protein NHX12_031237 [Muraenolepis orangiensis]|uniref:Uncharacterized protein n=1 Tax=Muraenolepis orangiensis TaxID=630683 RepID=A0A9Q0IKE5_9TELE|nr:hypothetical protein NHX12_031237 [Muraenolepis orangiensis]